MTGPVIHVIDDDDLLRSALVRLLRVKGYEVSAMKAAMEILGMPAGPVRPPLTNCTAQDVADLRALMDVYADVIPGRQMTAR